MVFPLLWNTDHLTVSVSIDFPLPTKRDAPFHDAAFDPSHNKWNGFCHSIRDAPFEGLSNLGASFDISKFHDYAKVVSHV